MCNFVPASILLFQPKTHVSTTNVDIELLESFICLPSQCLYINSPVCPLTVFLLNWHVEMVAE